MGKPWKKKRQAENLTLALLKKKIQKVSGSNHIILLLYTYFQT